jgi:acyl-CoA thioesterase I
MKSMNRTVALLALIIAVLTVLSGVETYMLSTSQSIDNKAAPIRVACVGDSLTRGTEYTLDLWSMLGDDYIVGDFGLGGATVDADSGSGYVNDTAFTVAEDFQPNIVIIMLGTNDASLDLNESAASFISDYTALVTAFQSLESKPAVWVVAPPPIYENPGNLSEAVLAQKIIPAIQQVAQQMNLPLIDVHTSLVGHEDYFIDGIHPKAGGAKIIAQTIYAALKPSLIQ